MRMRHALIVLALCPAGASGQGTIAIRNVTVIPMTGAGAAPDQSVIVRDGRIVEIGPAARIRSPAGATVVNGTGKYLIPGLFDMHTHTSKTRASGLGLFVLHGVTTVRDQGSEHAEVLRWRREVRAGSRVGPRMVIAGPYLESLRNIERMRRDPPESRVEPFERARIPVGSPADAQRIIDSLAALELDHFKIRTVQDRETYLALARAAHARGKRLTGHIVTASRETFLEARQDGVDHGFPISIDSLPRDQRMAFWRELASRDVGVVPTLVVVGESVFRPLAYYQALVTDSTDVVHPLRPYLSRFLVLDWKEQVEELTPDRRTYFDRAWPIMLRHTREMREAGVRIMAGSDVAVLNIFPGESLHEELRLFVDSIGMSPMEALMAATRKPAEWLKLADSVGTIEPGKVADLVLLDADPLRNIGNTRRIGAVVVRGRLFDRRGLDALRASVANAPDRRVNDWVRTPAFGMPPNDPDSWKLAGTAKVLCSALFVSGRDSAEARAHVADYFLREKLDSITAMHVDRQRKLVRLTLANRVTREAKQYGDQGCIIHQLGRDTVFFTPVRVTSRLPDAATTPWPMGDLLPTAPLPAGLDTAKLRQATDTVFANPAALTAGFVVVHRGRIVAERYASGAQRDMQLESWSMGKSITGTLVGMLIQQGAFRLEDPAPVPEWRKTPGDPRAGIRVIDLLRMSSGLRFSRGSPEDLPGYHDHDLIYTGAIDAFQFAVTREPQFAPNTRGRYRNVDVMTLGLLIRDAVRARGEDYLTWPQRALFDKIGIRRQVLETDPYGNFLLSGYDYGTPRNWARLGMLYLNDGVWDGERLLPEGWTRLVSAPAPAWADSSYGGMVWVNARGVWPLPRDAFAFRGAGGQETYVVPSLDLVVVRMGHFPGARVGAQSLQRALRLIADAVPPRGTGR